MKQIRFGLDDKHLDANLCAEIEKIRNGGSWNDACRLYLRILHYQTKCQNSPPERQNTAIERVNNDKDISEEEINLSGLDATFLE
jgi:hypothetical protein